MSDTVLSKASAQIAEAVEGVPVIKAFFDPDTFTVSYVVHDPQTMRAAIIDSVLDYDPASGRTVIREVSDDENEGNGGQQ